MIKKLFKAGAHGVNILALCSIVGVGAFYWEAAKAEGRMAQFSQEDMHCLQQNIYFEARGESILGQRAVAWVTLNRMDSNRYPNTVCEVVWQRRQFSWTHDGKPDTPGTNSIEQRAWHRAALIARSVTRKWAQEHEGPVEGAIMFHADWVQPSWARSYEQVVQVDSHIFYK